MVKPVGSLTSGDGVVLVTNSLDAVNEPLLTDALSAVRAQAFIEPKTVTEGCVVGVKGLGGGRLIYAPTGPLDRDVDDSRRFTEAGSAGIKRAIACGCKVPTLVVVVPDDHSTMLVVLGALDAMYVPLEIREDVPSKAHKLTELHTFSIPGSIVKKAVALDNAKGVGRDIGGSDPERMAPPRVEEYVRSVFEGTSIQVEVLSDDDKLLKEYPLFSAVNRCAKHVPRHKGRIIYLTYTPPGEVQRSLYLVGKGVTYDTGGADIKAGGVMAGMHRDKCGSAGVAAYMKFLDELRPSHLQVTAAMCMVRNSVGSECYVADEIITSRAGVRVRVGNTDAEGRMAMADALARMKELAQDQPDPHIFTWATLTGHAVLAMGEGYTAIMSNGPASKARVSQQVQDAGESMAEPVEISSIRREDYDFHTGKSEYEDVLQSNNAPSSRTHRGHQSPAAFMIMASGLNKHGLDSSAPLKYSHVDIAASSGPFPGVPTAAPFAAFAKAFSPELF